METIEFLKPVMAAVAGDLRNFVVVLLLQYLWSWWKGRRGPDDKDD